MMIKAVCFLLAATAAASASAETWALVPKPRHVWQKRGAYTLPTNRIERADVRFVRDGRLAAEGYFLDVSPTAIVVKASTKAGEFYAMKTLEQLIRQCEIYHNPKARKRGNYKAYIK